MGKTLLGDFFQLNMSLFPKTGDKFNDRFLLLEQLGSGGLGTVFKARELDSGRELALKILHDKDMIENEEFGKRFLREAKTLGEMEHAGIVKIYFIGIDESGAAFLAMELLQGKSLREVLIESKQLSPKRAIMIVRRLAEVLEHVHARGVIHRDLKPENIMISDLPELDTVKLLDFGLASFHAEQKLTRTGAIIGTASYMSPEQCRGKRADERSDVYSLTVCFYEMLTGAPPFCAENPVNVLAKHISENVPELTQSLLGPVARPINAFISKGLAKEPDKRFQSMKEFLSELDLMEDSLASGGVTKSTLPVPLILTVVALIIVGSVLISVLKQNSLSTASSSAVKSAAESPVDPRGIERYEKRLALAKQDYDRWFQRFKYHPADISSYADKLATASSKLALLYQEPSLMDLDKCYAVWQKTIDLMLASHDPVCGFYIEKLREAQITTAFGYSNYDLAERLLNQKDVVFKEGTLADCDRRFTSVRLAVVRHRFGSALKEFQKVVSLPGVAIDANTPLNHAALPEKPYLAKRITTIMQNIDVSSLRGDNELTGALAFVNELNDIACEQYLDVSEKLCQVSEQIISRNQSGSAAWKKQLSRFNMIQKELSRNKAAREKESKR